MLVSKHCAEPPLKESVPVPVSHSLRHSIENQHMRLTVGLTVALLMQRVHEEANSFNTAVNRNQRVQWDRTLALLVSESWQSLFNREPVRHIPVRKLAVTGSSWWHRYSTTILAHPVHSSGHKTDYCCCKLQFCLVGHSLYSNLNYSWF